MTPMRHPFVASAAIVAIAAGAGLTARELGFNQNAWGVIAGLAIFLGCAAHERLSRR